MSKITSKRQVTVPKRIADRFGLGPGDQIEWVAEDDSIRVYPGSPASEEASVEQRLRWFDQATERQRRRQATSEPETSGERGWSREDAYSRGVPR